MKKNILFLLFTLLIIVLISCSDNIVSECETCADNENAGTKTTFSDIQSTLFDQNCVSCHSGNFASAGLDLSADVSYNNLVDAASNGSSLKRVEPFNSSASYLVRVLEGDNAPLMPPAARLSQAKIDSVKSWIDRGAAND